ncbi:Acyl-coenzyme A thioesterase 13 [Artemisia annua]|uniref:Acyl-coenzyme A thioesterase 13 n=1 Tax=Artemisia annua TaxID=35608 RepID=A0A2U1NKS5_ARTAN|nr:Acyl-coenzyme A thioesterase 13 [Artemisia annua]
MEKRTREYLRVTQQDSDRVTGLSIPTQPPEAFHSFYEDFTLRGIRVDRFQPGFVSCSFTVPPRLTDRNGNMAVGAIANLVDEIGATMVYEKDVPMNVSIDMSISYLSTAKLNDELEISAKLLGGKGAFNGTLVLLKNKATGEVIAEGRHSLISGVNTSPRRPEVTYCFYDDFALKGIKVDQLRHGFISCSLTVPPRLTDRNGDMAGGAIANLVDMIGGALLHEKDAPIKVSVDMSISYLSKAKLNDDLEVSAKLLGGKGAYNGTLVVLKNKATGELIAEGRHSLFRKPTSKI